MGSGRRARLACLGMLMIALAPIVSGAPAPPSRSAIAGDYGELIVGLDPSGNRLSGYFSSSTGRGQFSCIFYFNGVIRDGRAAVDSYLPGDPLDEHIRGVVTFPRPGAVTLALQSEHGGCWNVRHFADRNDPATFHLMRSFAWRSIRIVRAARAYLYPRPSMSASRRSYLVRGDGVGVTGSAVGQTEWLPVDFLGNGQRRSGWLRSADLDPVGRR